METFLSDLLVAIFRQDNGHPHAAQTVQDFLLEHFLGRPTPRTRPI